MRGVGANEVNWGNLWKNRIDRNVKQKAVSLWEGAMEGKSTLRWYKYKLKPCRELFCDYCSLGLEWTPCRLMVASIIVQGGMKSVGIVGGE